MKISDSVKMSILAGMCVLVVIGEIVFHKPTSGEIVSYQAHCDLYIYGCWTGALGGYMSGIEDPGYGMPLPGLLSDFDKPKNFEFSEAELRDALKAQRYLIVQVRRPIVINDGIVLTDQILDGGIYVSYPRAIFNFAESSTAVVKNATFGADIR